MRFRKNNPVLISGKLKLGATIITLTSILSACTGNPPAEQETCYKKASVDTHNIIVVNKDPIIVKDSRKNKLHKKSGNKTEPLPRDTTIIEPPPPDATCYMIILSNDTD